VTEAFHLHGLAAVRTNAKRRSQRHPVSVLTVDRRVMREALRLASGDARRIEIVSATTVIVR
jgi:hypothetical protein